MLSRAALRHRPGQAVALLLLAALITAVACFAPLYARSMGQSRDDDGYARVPPQTTSLQINSSGTPPGPYLEGATPPFALPRLRRLLPETLGEHFATPVLAEQGTAHARPDKPNSLSGQLIWRSTMCDHVVLVAGRCPGAAGEMLVSTADRDKLHLHPGDRQIVATTPVDPTHPATTVPITLRVVGVYRQPSTRWWLGVILTGEAGRSMGASAHEVAHTLHDTWLVSRPTFDTPLGPKRTHVITYPDGTRQNIHKRSRRPPFADRSNQLLLALDREHTGVDQLLALGGQIRGFDRSLTAHDLDQHVSTFTGIGDLVSSIRTQRHQARVTVPLLMLQLGLLALFVLWLVLGAATEQRRPEIAVALLRGRGRRGARRILLGELLPVILAGAALGVVASLLLDLVARMVFLPGDAPFEVRTPFWLALALAAVDLVSTTLLAVVRVTRAPVERLLRRVGEREAGWRLGPAEALLIGAAGAGTIAFVTGTLNGAAALVGPALLALLVGLLLAHLTMPLAAYAGRRALARGRVRLGLSVLDASRTGATRRTVALVTVAAALLVFAVDAVAIGARNRQLAAEQTVGAPRVLGVDTTDLAGLRAALHRADPAGTSATPVVRVNPPSGEALTTLAVEPRGFAHVAYLPRRAGALPLGRIKSPATSPLRITGDRASVTVTQTVLHAPGGKVPVGLALALVYPDGGVQQVPLGTLPLRSTRPHTYRSYVHCQRGCNLVGIAVTGRAGAEIQGAIVLGALRDRHGRLPLTPASQWQGVSGPQGDVSASGESGGKLALGVDTKESEGVTLQQAWFPTTVPALVTGSLPPGSHGNDFQVTGLDTASRDAVRAASVRRIPGAPPRTALVNLDVVARGSLVFYTDQAEVWLGRDDPALAHRVTAALARQHIPVTSQRSVRHQRRTYDQSAAGWSLDLGVAIGVAGLLIAMLVVVVIAAAGWRGRARDLAALRMAGLARRTARSVAVAEQLLAVAVAVVAGAACGTVGAQLALGSVPLFTRAPAVSTLTTTPAWPAVAAALLGALVLLGAVGVAAGRATAARARLDRLRGDQ